MRVFELPGSGARLRYHDLPGAGAPILFVHGLGCAASCDYPRGAADPALAGRRMLLVDLLGFGFSDRPVNFGYTVEDHADSLVALLRGLELPPADIVGHSIGGSIAIVVAARAPALVRRLVASEPNLDPGGGFFSSPVAAQSEQEYVTRGHTAVVQREASEGQIVWAGSLRISAPFAVHRGSVSLVRGSVPSWREQLLGLSLPRTIIFGGNSLPDPDIEGLPPAGVATRVIPDVGHSMIWENPSAYARAVRGCLTG